MPYSLEDPGIFMSLNLRAVHVLPQGAKNGNWLEVLGKLQLCLICFNLAFSELLCQSGGKLTLEVEIPATHAHIYIYIYTLNSMCTSWVQSRKWGSHTHRWVRVHSNTHTHTQVVLGVARWHKNWVWGSDDTGTSQHKVQSMCVCVCAGVCRAVGPSGSKHTEVQADPVSH